MISSFDSPSSNQVTMTDATDPTARMQARAESGVFVIGSRDSALAMFQAREVQRKLTEAWGPERGFTFEIISTKALGDRILNQPLAVLAGSNPGLFTKELEGGLASGHFDIAVHSLKDMPTALPGGLALASITEREAEEDVLLVHPAHKGCGGLAGLPEGAVVGTSSVRRRAFVMRNFKGLRIVDIRGNLQRRLQKLQTSTPITAAGGGAESSALALSMKVRKNSPRPRRKKSRRKPSCEAR